MNATPCPEPDFLPRRARGQRLAWAAAATATLVLGVSALEAHDTWQTREGAQARLAMLQARAPARPAAGTAAPRGLSPVTERLARPWAPIFTLAESASLPGVQWLLLDAPAERPELRLEGLVPDAEVASALVAALAAQPGWHGVVLTRLQRDAGGGGVRFEIGAQRAASGAGPQSGRAPGRSQAGPYSPGGSADVLVGRGADMSPPDRPKVRQ